MRVGLARALLLVAALGCVVCGTVPASAQNDPVSGFFRMLFGAPQQSRQPPVAIPDPNAAPKRPSEPRVVETPKNPDAQVVLVIGDIEAQGLGTGLKMIFAEEPSIAVTTKTRNASGLTRESEGEWSTLAPKVLAENKADFIVVMVGVNDWQTIPVPGSKSLEIAGEEWNKVYGERLDNFIAQLKATGKPFWWVGLPPTADADRRPTARAAYAAFLSALNDLARPRVQAAGGGFVDIWNAFTDEEGHYTAMGPDVEGQIKKLRTNDGILFTRVGQRKLAFFVEQEIRKVMRGETAPSVLSLPEETTIQPKGEEALAAGPPPLPPAPWSVVGPVIPLGRTAGQDGDGGLAGGPGRARGAEYMPGGFPVAANPAHRRLVEGLPIDPPAGRVDDMVRRTP